MLSGSEWQKGGGHPAQEVGWLWLAFSSSQQLGLSEPILPSWLAKPKWTIIPGWWLSAWKGPSLEEPGQEKQQPSEGYSLPFGMNE